MHALLTVILLNLLVAASLRAQPLDVRIYTGIEVHGWNSLEELVDAQQQDLHARGVPAKRVAAFPPHLAAHVEAALPVSDATRVGVGVGYGSTGSRLHYGDYSGEIVIDMVAERWHLSLSAEQHVPGPLPLWLMLQTRYSFSEVTASSLLQLYQQSRQEDERLTGRGLSLVAGTALEVQRGPLVARFSGAFEYAFTHWLQLDALTHRLYYEGEATNMHAGWTGMRAGVTVGYRL